MKVAISSTGPNLTADVDPRFGRAAFLLIYDTDKHQLLEAIDNSAGQDAAQGAGITVAGMLADKGVAAIVTGRVGPKAMAVIDKAAIKIFEGATGTVQEALARLPDQSVSRAETGSADRAGSGCRLMGGSGMGMGRGRGRGGRGGRCRIEG
ncbi:MAG: dinitrogenase iron-molybdenum cofactor biosynthesis protein [Desulfobulbaceae bacterium]|nr:MAG: dinitrogenase iron-molybdenum cofactor biosynthesis protein [Desulfobulbaceae bacterium]